jgi:type II secretory pathway pseudopilin PulG
MNPDSLPLRDIHLPAAIGGWPPALGWWLLAALMLGVVGLLGWLWWQRKGRDSALEAALQTLEQLQRTHRKDPQTLLRELSVLLRRTAISVHGRQAVAGLTGAAWLGFLNQQAGKVLFSKPLGSLLTEQPYRADAPTDTAALVDATRTWIKLQRGKGHV